jgi:hypothetical protein
MQTLLTPDHTDNRTEKQRLSNRAHETTPKIESMEYRDYGYIRWTWNVRSMYDGKLNIVQRETNRMDIHILGVNEMKWIGSGHFRSANNTVMYSGQTTHRRNGVGMIITNRVSKSLIGYKAVNDRFVYI